MSKDYRILHQLSSEQEVLLDWCSRNPPKPRARSSIPQQAVFLCYYDGLACYTVQTKVFPLYKDHRKACRSLGIRPAPKFSLGTPPDIAKELLRTNPPDAVPIVLDFLYQSSRFDKKAGIRIAEVSNGLICSQTGYSKRTIARALVYLRGHRYARRIWRGQEIPRSPRYQHSGYELPYDHDHVVAWRIHGFY